MEAGLSAKYFHAVFFTLNIHWLLVWLIYSLAQWFHLSSAEAKNVRKFIAWNKFETLRTYEMFNNFLIRDVYFMDFRLLERLSTFFLLMDHMINHLAYNF